MRACGRDPQVKRIVIMRGAWRKWRFGKFPDEPEELSLSELSRKVPATQCAAPSARRSGDNGRGLWIVMSSDNTDHTENTASNVPQRVSDSMRR